MQWRASVIVALLLLLGVLAYSASSRPTESPSIADSFQTPGGKVQFSHSPIYYQRKDGGGVLPSPLLAGIAEGKQEREERHRATKKVNFKLFHTSVFLPSHFSWATFRCLCCVWLASEYENDVMSKASRVPENQWGLCFVMVILVKINKNHWFIFVVRVYTPRKAVLSNSYWAALCAVNVYAKSFHYFFIYFYFFLHPRQSYWN